MRRLIEPLIVTVIILLACWLQVGWVRVWPIGGSSVNVVVLTVIAIALFRSWSTAVWTAAVAGLTIAQYSVWPWPIYPLAFLGMVGALRLITQRLIAAKSRASLIIAISIATAVFYALLAVAVEVTHVFSPAILRVVWPQVVLMMIVQSLIHPLILYFLWQRTTGGSFSTAVTTQNIHQPF